MTKYLLLGYNSGGYKSSVKIEFDGKIEKLYRPDPNYPDTPSTMSYFQITDKDGNTTEEDNVFMDKLILEHRGYHESFLVTQIIEVNEEKEPKKKSFFKKISTLFPLLLLITFPLFGKPIIDLDFSGLESLSKMGKQLGKVPKIIYKKPSNVFVTKEEVLAFHNDYVNAHPNIKSIVNLVTKNTKQTITLKENNLYEIQYNLENEQLRFYYYIDATSTKKAIYLSNLYILLEQKSIPVWTQETKFFYEDTTLTTFAQPYQSKEIFYNGTIKKTQYQYKDKKINEYQKLSFDKAYRLQPVVLLAYEEYKAIIDTKQLFTSYIQSVLLKLEKKYRNSTFQTSISHEKLTLKEAEEHCDSLSIDGSVVWHLPREKDLISLSSNAPSKQSNGNTIFIQEDYIKIFPLINKDEELTFWTSNLEVIDKYELGKVISFSYSLDQLQNDPIDLVSDKKTKHYVICQKAENPINIRWGKYNFISIYGNNFRISPDLKLVGSFDFKNEKVQSINFKSSEAYFPLKDVLLIKQNDQTIYLLDLQKRKKIGKIKLSSKYTLNENLVFSEDINKNTTITYKVISSNNKAKSYTLYYKDGEYTIK